MLTVGIGRFHCLFTPAASLRNKSLKKVILFIMYFVLNYLFLSRFARTIIAEQFSLRVQVNPITYTQARCCSREES